MENEEIPGIERVALQKSPLYRRERHLASAIITTEIEYMFRHHDNPAALRPHHKRLLEDVQEMNILPATSFLSWCVKNLSYLYTHDKAGNEMLRRAEKVAHLAVSGSYSHYYKTTPPQMTQETFPLDTIYSSLALTWNHVISEVAQSFILRQEIKIGEYLFIFNAELCLVQVTTHTCYLVPYSLILCFADMCAAWFSIDCYASLYNLKYPGFKLHTEVRNCLQRIRAILENHQQSSYIHMYY